LILPRPSIIHLSHLLSYPSPSVEFLVATIDPREVDIEDLSKAFNIIDEDG
jgi:hypothetical protein